LRERDRESESEIWKEWKRGREDAGEERDISEEREKV
jgi:hypothetical protein